MRRLLFIISAIIIAFLLSTQAHAQGDQTLNNGEATTPVFFGGAGCYYNWTNSNPAIGLPASGKGNLPSFIAKNLGTSVANAVITAAPAATYDTIYMASQVSPRATITVNASDGKRVYGLQTGAAPFGVAISPGKNSRAYITNQGSGTVSVFQVLYGIPMLVIEMPVGADPLTSAPEGVAASPDGKWIYVANSADNSLSVIKTATLSPAGTIPLNGVDHPSGIVVSPDGQWVYVTNYGSASVSRVKVTPGVDSVSGTITGLIPVQRNPEGIAISPDGNTLYVANYGSNSVSIHNISANTTTTLPVGTNPFGITLSRSGTTLYVANSGSDDVTVIDATNKTVKRTVSLAAGSSPRGIATTADDKSIYIADYGDAFMSVIDASSFVVSQQPTLDIGNVSFGNFVNGGTGCIGSPVTFNITVNPTTPTLTATGPIPALHTSFGIPSPSGSFTVSGVTLSEPITITAPTGFELSTDNVTFSSILTLGGPGNVNATTIYVRLAAGTREGTYNDVIRLHSSPATDVTIAVTGDVEAAKPYISVGPVTGSITGCAGSPSVAPHLQQFKVSASNLRGILSAYTTSPNFQVSLDPDTGYGPNITLGNGGNVNVTVYVRSVAANPGYLAATVNIFSPGADQRSVTVNSIISPEPVADPVSSQIVADNTATTPVTFTGQGSNTFTWTNDHPEIGLPASGRGDINSFTAVNITNKRIVATITATPIATGLAYVTNLSANTLSVVDLTTRTVIPPVVSTGASPRFMLVGPDGTKIYVANYATADVSVIDAGNHRLIKNIPVGLEPIGLELSPDGKTMRVFNLLTGMVTLIDVINDVAIATIPLEGYPPGTPFSPDGKWAYPFSFDSSDTFAVDMTGSGAPSALIGEETIFGATVVSPDGTRVYSTSRGIVKVYNEADNTLITTIDLAGHVENQNINSLALSPDGNTLYATYGINDQIFVIDTHSFEVTTTLDGGRYPYNIAISPGTGCSGVPVQFTITVEPTPPTIVVSGTADPLTTPQGIPSPYTHVNVSGLRLTDDIHIDAPAGFELSLDGLTFSSSVSISQGTNNGTVPPTPLYIRLTGARQGSYTGNVHLYSTGAQDVNVPVSGTVTQPRPTLYATEASGTIMACMGEASESPFLQQLQVHAALLQQGVTVGAPQGFEVSLDRDPGSFASRIVIPGNPDGSLGITTVYVRAGVAAVASPISGVVTISSPGAVDLPVQVEGTINPLPGVQQVSKITVAGGSPVSINFTPLNGANAFTWTNDNTAVGLAEKGGGNISFTAVNNTSEPVTARVTVTPKSAAKAYIAASNARVMVLNTGSDKEENPILSDNTRATPYAVAISPDGKWVYVADQASINQQGGLVSVINTGTNQVVQTVYAGNRPSGLVVSPDGKTLYVTNSGSYDMSVIDLQGPAPVKLADIPVGNDPEGIAITPEGGKWLYMTNRNTTTNVVVLNTADLHQPPLPIALGLHSPKSIAVLPDGSRVYVTDENSNNIGVINNETKTPMPAIAAGGASSGIAVSPDGAYIYVSSTGLAGAGSVKVIRTSDNSLVRSVSVGRNPKGLSLTPDGTRIYVACSGSTVSNGSVYMIDNQHPDAEATAIQVSGPPSSYGTFITGGTGCDGAPMTFDIEVTPSASSVGVSGTLTALTTTYGTPSASVSFTVQGNTISSPIAVMPPAGFELSTDNSQFKPSLSIGAANTTIHNTPVYVRLSGTTPAGEYSGNITLAIGNGSPANVPAVLSTVLPAPMTIRADDKTRLTGVDNPPLTATYTGFVNKESPLVLTNPVVLTTTARTDSPIGQYPITAAGATAQNYAITYEAGVLTILDAPPVLSAPNTFTPNGDGINDVWTIRNMDSYPGCTVAVFNRNGQRVFFSVGYPSPWNGRYNGTDLPSGTYYYIITPGNGLKPITGYVAIIR